MAKRPNDRRTRWALELGCLEPLERVAANVDLGLEQREEDYLVYFRQALDPFGILLDAEDWENAYASHIHEVYGKWRMDENHPNVIAALRALLFPGSGADGDRNPFVQTETWIKEFLSEQTETPVSKPLESTLLLPIQLARRSLINRYVAAINDQWKREVCDPFRQDFHGRFPFVQDEVLHSLATIRDVDCRDFVDFFKRDGGTLFGFLTEHLSPVITRSGDAYQSTSTKDMNPVDPAFLRFVNDTYRISRFLLDDRGDFRDYELTLETGVADIEPKQQELYISSHQVCFQCDPSAQGCLLTNEGPPVLRSWTWSVGECREAALSFIVEGRFKSPERRILSYDGEWSLLRLLRHARCAGESLEWQLPIPERGSSQNAHSAVIPFRYLVDRNEDPLTLPFHSVECPDRVFR